MSKYRTARQHPLHPPKDYWLAAYFFFVIQGVHSLLPFNVFITANEYFSRSFQGSQYAWTFQNFFTFASLLTGLVCVIISMTRQAHANYNRQILLSSLINILAFSLLLLLTLVPSLPPVPSFAIAMTLLIITSATSAYMQNSLFALSSHYPSLYVQGIMTGQGLAGVLASVIPLSILLGTIETDPTSHSNSAVTYRAQIYFTFAILLSLLGLSSFLVLRRLPIHRYYVTGAKKAREACTSSNAPIPHHEVKEQEADESGGGGDLASSSGLYPILRHLLPLLLTIIIAFTVTMTLFPAITVGITPTNPAPVTHRSWTHPEVFVTMHFLIFNILDLLGRALPGLLSFLVPKKGGTLLLLSLLRTIFIPLILLCHVETPPDILSPSPPMIGDIGYLIILILFALSNGWITSACFMRSTDTGRSGEEELGGMVMSVALNVGLVLGSIFSFLVKAMVCQCNPL